MAHNDETGSGFASRIASLSRSRSRSPYQSKSIPVSPTSSTGSKKSGKRVRESLDSNETSPLLSPVFARNIDSLDPLAPEGTLEVSDGGESSKTVFYLFILTLGIGGLQIAWSVETSNGSPFLLSLGMSKSLLALVWIAGPLGGVLVQPYVGIRSDNCRVSWGKRRPFMIAGATATAVSFIALAWSKEIIHGFLGLFGAGPEARGVQVFTIIWATVFVYVLDFAINAGEVHFFPFSSCCSDSSYSPGSNTSLYRRQCTYASARRCQCLGRPHNRRWKHSGLSVRLCRPPQTYSLARKYPDASSMLNCCHRHPLDSGHLIRVRQRTGSTP